MKIFSEIPAMLSGVITEVLINNMASVVYNAPLFEVMPALFVEEIEQQRRGQVPIVRDIFGNPFRSLVIDRSWLSVNVQAIAEAAYEERLLPAGTLDNNRLAILADALEDASCTDPAVLGHLRGPGPHVRGCHVLDAILGKE